jgi:hypothetical protein
MDCTEDTVRYYFLCKGCVERVEYSGTGGPPNQKTYRVV